MQEKSWTNLDRKGWPSGEWDSEPDKVQFVDQATGLPCLAVRHPSLGHWCGYVGVPPGHPLHGKDYRDVDASVHGDLTFASACLPDEDEGHGVCHVPDAGESDDVWWLGFDCAHSGDLAPKPIRILNCEQQYRTLEYVKGECASLAEQIKAQETATA